MPEDIAAMLVSLRTLGVSAGYGGDGRLWIGPPPRLSPAGPLDVGAAGTALRFLLPLAALHCRAPVRFVGAPRLFARPLAPLLEALAACGAAWEADAQGGLLAPPSRRPAAVDLRIDATQSSQFISGMAMAAAGLPRGGELHWQGPMASRGYLALTLKVMEKFHPKLRSDGFMLSMLGPERRGQTLAVQGGALRPAEIEIPGDWSAAAPFLCAAAVLGRRVEVAPLHPDDGQPDAAVLEILGRSGSAWEFRKGACVFDGRLEKGIDADLADCPDLAPVLAAAAAAAPGPSELRGLATLPHKESDRLEGMARLIAWMGGSAEVHPGPVLRVRPADRAEPMAARAPFDPCGDHRMAFAAAIGSLLNGGRVLDPACAAKSFPGFWSAWGEFLAAR
jgi:3-phosphoshikimate 1-carboxyvinyltransferase